MSKVSTAKNRVAEVDDELVSARWDLEDAESRVDELEQELHDAEDELLAAEEEEPEGDGDDD